MLINPRLIIDHHKQGTHAGLPHVRCDIWHEGRIFGYVDMHLHHNKKGLSVGTTTCVFTRQFPNAFEDDTKGNGDQS